MILLSQIILKRKKELAEGISMNEEANHGILPRFALSF